MKIASSQLSFSAERKYEEKDVRKREVEFLDNRSLPAVSGQAGGVVRSRIRISPRLFSNPASVPSSSSASDDSIPSDPKLAAMKRMLDALMGKKLKLTGISGFGGNKESGSPAPSSSVSQSLTASSAPVPLMSSPSLSLTGQLQHNAVTATANTADIQLPEIPARRIRISEFNSHYEAESTQFNALGSVRTENGESINFKLHLDMKREFSSEDRLQLAGGVNLTDPLVVNFSGKPAELTDVKFRFDINSDGKDEDISWLSSGRGFLVLDRNQDGVVNNGSELFGPETNNGFEELAELDEDKNGWIDENDSAFGKLSVWSGESPDSSQLKSLKDSGIGAIAVASEQTEFTVKDQQTQNTLGQIRRTGIYLEENGKAGTIQQLDLAV